jgi:hypothetical protein
MNDADGFGGVEDGLDSAVEDADELADALGTAEASPVD